MQSFRQRIARLPAAVPAYHVLRSIWCYPAFVWEWLHFRRLAESDGRFPIRWFDQLPRFLDRTATTKFDTHYLYHPAWAARIIARNRPARHVDISSILHFSTLVSTFVPVDFYDYRPAAIHLANLTSGRADLLALPFEDNSVESLSCMHVVEHVGLGRYGDPLDPRGDLKAIGELKRVLAPGGALLFVTPVGRARIEFNAHRIYSYAQIVTSFSGLTLKEFSLIPDDALEVGLIRDAAPDLVGRQEWACGCFWFTKSQPERDAPA